MSKPAGLIQYLFDEQPAQAAAQLPQELLGWMEASARFTTFVDTYRDKIRKKIRVTREAESLLDVRGELEVAYRLLADRRLEVAYEPYASAGRRGPDYSITYRRNTVFNIEVARIRGDLIARGFGDGLDAARIRGDLIARGFGDDLDAARIREDLEAVASDLPRKEERITRILLDKLGQMQPGMANLLVIHSGPELARAVNLERLLQSIKLRADGKDPAFYAASRYSTPAAFYKDFLHLSGILLWARAPRLWVNKQARPALDEKVLRLVEQLAGS